MKILDLSAGNRAIWFNRNHPNATYIDIRSEVNPDICCDSADLPFAAGEFDLVVFDPLHKNFSGNIGFGRCYGPAQSMGDIRSTIKGTAREAWRVTGPNGLMAYKWSDADLKLTKVVGLLAPWWEPLFGHGHRPQQRQRGMTSWVMLMRTAGESNFALQGERAA